MDIKNIFIAQGRLRAGWRILVFFLLLFYPLWQITLLLWSQLLVRYLIFFCLTLALSFLLARYLDKRPIATIGFMFHSRWLKEYLLGVLIGLVLVSILFIFELGMGYVEVKLNNITLSLLKNIFIFSLVITIFQSAFEELAFRGYMFQNLIEGTNTIIATVALSALFGIGHLMNPNSSWVAAINLAAFGVLHAFCYICTKSLWLPSGLHFSWNFFMGKIYSLPVSGTQSSNTILLLERKGPTWFTGGNFGPEAGIPALILLITTCFFIYYWKRIKVAPEMEKLWNNYKQKYNIK